jgi:AsmA protein
VKKVLIGLVAIVVVLVVVVLVLPSIVPKDTLRAQIESQMESATGREVTIAGDVGVSIIPSVELTLERVSIANAPGAADPNMVELGALRLKVGLFPLLGGELAVDEFVLDRPVIRLEVDAAGKPNWEFDTGASSSGDGDARRDGDDSKGGGAGFLNEIRLGDVAIADGIIVYVDRQAGSEERLDDVNLTLSLPNLDQPFRADGALTWHGEAIKLVVDVTRPRALLENQTTALKANVDTRHLTLSFDGNATGGTPLRLEGKTDLKSPSIREMAAWAGSPIAMEGDVLGPLAVAGTVLVAQPVIAFTGADIAVDAIRAKGNVELNTGGAVPRIKGNLDVAALDTNPYLGAGGSGSQDGSAGGGQAQAGSDDWSDDPIDLSALKSVNADFTLRVESILVQQIRIGKSALRLTVEGGLMTADLSEMALYDGQGKARVVANGSGSVPAVSLDFDLAGMQAEPLLTDAAGLDRISGTARGNMSVRGAGRSQREIVSNLNGNGAIGFNDGAIKGINLGAMLRNVTSAFTDDGAPKKTDFTEITGTFTITNGILKNDDLQMLSPLFRVTGAGTVEMPPRTVNYRITPKVVASSEGQGGDSKAAGITVPVVVSGPWTDLSYKPDLAGVLQETLKDPAKAKEAVQETIKGITKPEGGGDGGSNPLGVVRGLLKRD